MHKNIKSNAPSAKNRYNLINNPPYPKKKDIHSKNRTSVTVIGHRTSKEFIYCYHLVKGLCKYRSKEYEQPVLRGVTDVEWNDIWQNLKIQYGTKAINLDKVAVIINDELIGGENELKQMVESKYVYHLCLDYCKESIEQLRKYITSSGRPCAYMQISIDGEDAGTLLFSLYSDLVPRTCENFLRLCEATKGGYAGTPIHRIVKDCWIQCGGFGLKDDPNLGCENFLVPHDRRGVLCMANNGRNVECSTQFFVLLQPAPWMKHKYVGFGQLIEGEKTLRKIENVLSWYESPTQDIVIYKAGVLNMDCQYKPINKNTHQYLEGHVEDLIALGEFLYEELLRKVFEVVELIQKQKLDNIEVEVSVDDKNTPDSDVSEENNDFEVETYENEYQYYSPNAHSRRSNIQMVKPFYIPFTDVPYEGEVDSQYDLLRLLMGNYCYDVDLESDREKRKSQYHGERLSIPYGFVSEVFDSCSLDDSDTSDDSSIDSSKLEIYDNYVSQYMTSVSFAGHVVRKIANLNEKFDVVEDIKEADKVPRLLTDEELRILRVAKKEYQTRQPKSVSISLVGSKFSHNKIIRRPTGFVFLEDLAELGISMETLEGDHETEREDVRKFTGSEYYLSLGLRESTFVRLMDSVKKHSEENDVPTLKNYKSILPEQQKNIDLISFSETCHLTNVEPYKTVSEWELYRALGVFKDIHRVPLIPQSPKVFGKSPTANFNYEHENNASITALEFAKKRPTITVRDYKMKNKQYRKQLLLNAKTGKP